MITKVRLKMVKFAAKHGIKPAAKAFECSKNTVKYWRNEFNSGNHKLKNKSKIPCRSPNKIKPYWEFLIVSESEKLLNKKKRTNASKLKKAHIIPYSTKTIRKVLIKYGLTKINKKKHERKNDLREYKKKYKAFEKIQIDVKYLDDIPEFYDEYMTHNLPKYQFTARCIRTGALFFCYGREKTITNAVIFVNYLLNHLKKYKITPRIIQTDNGVEFIQNWQMIEESIFTLAIKNYKSEHRLIPPGAKTWQSDVESSHRLIEDDFYSYEIFNSNPDFFNKARKYQTEFNIERKNTYKENKSPKDLLEEIAPEIKTRILKLDPIILDKYIDKYFFKVAA
jgi:transposase-like protein